MKKQALGSEGSPVTTPGGKLSIAPELKTKIHDAAQEVASAAKGWRDRPAPPTGFEIANEKLLAYPEEAAAFTNQFDIAAQTGDPGQLELAETQMQ